MFKRNQFLNKMGDSKNLPFKDKFHTIYFSGCSYTEGGGLNPAIWRTYRDRDYHKRYLDIDVDRLVGERERDGCYPTLVGKELNLFVQNDAACGGGIERSIRKIYDYINSESIERLQETIFFLELAPGTNRWDMYSNEEKDYLICNLNYDKDYNKQIYLTKNYLVPTFITKEYFQKYSQFISDYYDLEFNDTEKQKEITNKLLGLISFFYLNNIEFYLSGDLKHLTGISKFYPDLYQRIFYLNVDDKKYSDISEWSRNVQNRIEDDLFNSTDGHPGLLAHRIWAKEIVTFLNNKYL